MSGRRDRGSAARSGATESSIWERGLLGHIPNRLLRRPLKVARAAVTVPTMMLGGSRRDMSRLPTFLGIGGARCGTTWLHYNLDAHPGICMPDKKELRFWDRNLGWGLKYYSSKFDPEPGQILGEITPGYGVISPWRVKLMARVFPDLRIVYLLRDPVERAWSHVGMWAGRRDLSPSDLSSEHVLDVLNSEPCVRQGMYSNTYRLYADLFSDEQVYVGFYEDLRERPHALFSEILEHIGASTDFDWDALPLERRFNSTLDANTRANSSSGIVPDTYRRLLSQRYRIELADSARMFGGPAEKWEAAARAFIE